MGPIQKTLWLVETHSRGPLTLESLAGMCNVSQFHLTRAFASTLGVSLMQYVRGRRLTEAAIRLADGADDILNLALEFGYGSHEAFTRAFRSHFGLTPEQVRARGNLANLQLVEAIVMNTAAVTELIPPRLETRGPLVLAGLVERYACDAKQGIPDQWQRFVPYIGSIPGQIGQATYGVNHNMDDDNNFDYLSGVEVQEGTKAPDGLKILTLPGQKYAVFTHKGHIANIGATYAAIWNQWFPESGHEAAPAPLFERYGAEFNPMTGAGSMEIWIPIKK